MHMWLILWFKFLACANSNGLGHELAKKKGLPFDKFKFKYIFFLKWFNEQRIDFETFSTAKCI